MAGPPGFDTANLIQNVRVSAVNTYGTPTFWARYCGPLQANTPITVSSSNAITEMRALWDSGARYFVPIFEPGSQSRLSGSSATGQSDGTAFCDALKNLYFWVGPLLFPSTNRVYSYLGQESSTSLSAAYWDGWATAVNTYPMSGHGVPFYAGLYCAPKAPPPNCSSAVSPNAYSIWTSTPERCSQCVPFSGAPSWGGGDTCFNGLPTHLWQTAEQGVCVNCGKPNVNVDLDEADLDSNASTSSMFVLNSRP